MVSVGKNTGFDRSACAGCGVSLLIPVFNDWEALVILLQGLDAAAGAIIVMDSDGEVLIPAQAWLDPPFDKAVDPFRRYSRKTFWSAGPEGMRLVMCRCLDCAELAASSANTVLLGRSLPTRRQIFVWDRCLVSVSSLVDPLPGYACGKSVLAVRRNRPA
jgi:hypothetical protein